MSSDSFSTVPPIVNGSDRGFTVHDLKTIIILVLLTFNFVLQMVTPLTNLAEVTIHGLCYYNSMPGEGTTAIKVESSA